MTPQLQKSTISTHDSISKKINSYMKSKPSVGKFELRLTKKVTDNRSGGRIFELSKDLPRFKTVQ